MNIADPETLVSMLENVAPVEGDIEVGSMGIDSLHWRRGPFARGLGGLSAPVTVTANLPLVGQQNIPLNITVNVSGPVTDERGQPVAWTEVAGGAGIGFLGLILGGIGLWLARKK